MKAVFDKFAIFHLAKEHGIAIPQTLFVENQADFFAKKCTIPQFPVVVKPAMSRIPTKDGFLATSVKYAIDMVGLEKLYATEPALQFPSMIQEKIIGPGTGCFLFFIMVAIRHSFPINDFGKTTIRWRECRL